MRKLSWLIAGVIALAIPWAANAQQPTTGALKGVVGDRDGKALPGATVLVTGPLGERGIQTDANGNFEIRFLPTGTYRIKVEMPGFATIEIPGISVNAGQSTRLPITLLTSQEEEVNVTARPLLDAKRTEIVTNFSAKESVETLPVGRNFTDVVNYAPGVVDGGATGDGNYSIGGSSGLENSYIIDGVNITDSGYGGVGSYSIVYGSLGTGITSQFLEEVQVKSGGFEAEYGQALGGIVAGTLRSGTNDFSGSVSAYVSPASWEAQGKDVVLSTGAVPNIHERSETDLGVSVGGPILKDKLYWFAGFNPTETSADSFAQALDNPLLAADPGVSGTYPSQNVFASAGTGKEVKRSRDNYAAKLNWALTPNHRLELTAFGDPGDGDGRSGATAGQFVLAGFRDTNGNFAVDAGDTPYSRTAAFTGNARRSDLTFGADQQSLRYNGLFGGEWFLEAQVNHRKNSLDETSLLNDFQYTDNRILRELQFSRPTTLSSAVFPTSGGAGTLSNQNDETWDYSVKLSKTFGAHELKAGLQYFDLQYAQPNTWSGPTFDVYFTDANSGNLFTVPTTTGALVQVRNGIPGCSLCNFSTGNPQYRTTRTGFNPISAPVEGTEASLFLQDTWNINDKWVVKLGVRSSQQKLDGGASSFVLPLRSDPVTGAITNENTLYSPNSYSFKTELSPRLGVSFDPRANGKTKLYANFARYFERVPADLAVRQFANQVGTTTARFRDPELTFPNVGIQPNLQGAQPGVVCGQRQAVNPATGEPLCTGNSRLPYVDEVIVGWQQLVRPDLSVEVRGIYRDQGRVLEDVQFASNEEIQNLYYTADLNGDGSITSNEIPFPSFGTKPFGAYVLANPGENTPGVFGTPERVYKAMEVVMTKNFADRWMFSANYRYSRLRGNYEGLFRNDNAQSDPNISSLFDFPLFSEDGKLSRTMRGQFQNGPLNTDRPHVMHLLGTYTFDNGVELGGIFNWASGVPRTAFLAHPNYQNAGEIPGQDPLYLAPGDTDGDGNPDSWVLGDRGDPGTFFLGDYSDSARGSLGRTPDFATMDLHIGYARAIKDTRLKLTLDVSNLFNAQEAGAFNDNVELTAGAPDPTFGKIIGYQLPRAIRFGAIWDF